MKLTPSRLLLTATIAVALSASFAVNAQYKSPRQYFRKDSPGVNNGTSRPANPATPSAPAAPGTSARPATPPKPTFKDVALNSTFYFLNDTNRAFAWTKVSATTAKNGSGVTRAFSGETLIQK